MGDKCVENIPVTKYIDLQKDGVADREPVAPTLEATILWSGKPGAQSSKGCSWGVGQRGWDASTKGVCLLPQAKAAKPG